LESDIVSIPKLRLYVKFKADYGETEGYVQRTRVKAHRSLLARLKGATSLLKIETGRYVCLPVEERTCKTCNSGMVEDEEFFCVGCPGLKEARGPLLKSMKKAHSGFGLLQDEEKFIRIMLHANADSRVGKFLYSMFLDRTS